MTLVLVTLACLAVGMASFEMSKRGMSPSGVGLASAALAIIGLSLAGWPDARAVWGGAGAGVALWVMATMEGRQ